MTEPFTSDHLLAHEEELVFTGFTHDDAWTLGSLLVEVARDRELPVAVDIRRNGQQLFHHARPGTAPDNAAWIERKINVVQRFGHSSLLVGQRHRDKGTTFEEATGLPRDTYAAHGGAFPIRVVNAGIVGTVTVSGLPQVEDHALVVEAVRRFLHGNTEEVTV